MEKSRWFKNLQRWRAGGEGTISVLKRKYGLDNKGFNRTLFHQTLINDMVFKKYGSLLDRLKRRMDEAYEKEEKRLIEEYESQFPGRSVSIHWLWEERDYTRRCS